MSEPEYIWWSFDSADLELDGCYLASLEGILGFLGFSLTGFYDDAMSATVDEFVTVSSLELAVEIYAECAI
jgi:hypothetical protein